MKKWWDTDILNDYDRATEDWLSIVNRLPPVRTEDGKRPTYEQLRFWYLQLQPKQRWAYSTYRASLDNRSEGAQLPKESR